MGAACRPGREAPQAGLDGVLLVRGPVFSSHDRPFPFPVWLGPAAGALASPSERPWPYLCRVAWTTDPTSLLHVSATLTSFPRSYSYSVSFYPIIQFQLLSHFCSSFGKLTLCCSSSPRDCRPGPTWDAGGMHPSPPQALPHVPCPTALAVGQGSPASWGSPASSVLAREGAGCGSVGDVPGAWLAWGHAGLDSTPRVRFPLWPSLAAQTSLL